MKPSNHRTMTLAEATATFAIERLLGEDFDELIGHRLEEDDAMLVFEGDTACAGDLDLSRNDPTAFGEPFDRWPHELIVVAGNLTMARIDLWQVQGLVVLGDLICDEIHLRETPLYVRDRLLARTAVRATAEKEWHDERAQTLGPLYVRVKGVVSSPLVETWCMPLQHLKWTGDSGRETPLVLR